MSPFQKKVFCEMIVTDLQQGLELIEADKFNLAIHHFEQAVVKAKELRDLNCSGTSEECRQPEQQNLIG